MTISGELIMFSGLALVAVTGGILLLNLKSVVHIVVGLVFTFLSIAGIFVLLSAEFLAVVQVLVYSGAITIIMLFGIMLTKHDDRTNTTVSPIRKVFLYLGILAFAFVFYVGIHNLQFPSAEVPLHDGNIEQIGLALFTKYIIPLEILGVLLLVALVGAIVLARREDKEEEVEER